MDIWMFLQNPEEMSWKVAFLGGVVVTVVVVLLIVLWAVLRHRRREQPLRLPGETGELILTANAVKEFVDRVVSSYNESSLKWVKIQTVRGSVSLHIGLAVVPGTAVVPLVQRLRQELQTKAQTELGVEENIRINITVKSLSAKDRTRTGESSAAARADGPQSSTQSHPD